MITHLSGDQIDRYLARTLTAGDVLALHEHTEGCPECRKALSQAALARMPCLGAPLLAEAVESHLSEEEMVALVSRRMPEAQRAQASRHVAACEVCAESVEAMESVRDHAVQVHRSRPVLHWLAAASTLAAGVLVAVLAYRANLRPSEPPRPAMMASLHDAGGVIELDAQGTLRGLDTASPEERNLVREALAHQTLPSGPVVPAEAPGVLLGAPVAPPAFEPTGPLNIYVLSDRPTFSWQPYAGAESYQVLVTNENLDPLARSPMLTSTQWRPDTSLPRGAILLWQVRAWKAGEMVSAPAPPAPPARFEIVAADLAARIEQVRNAPQPSHLLAAVLCAQAGLKDEAAKELQALARENPDSKVVGGMTTGGK